MESPDSGMNLGTEKDLGEMVSILICVPSGALNFNDWLKGGVMVVVVDIFAEVPVVATGGLGCWRVGG